MENNNKKPLKEKEKEAVIDVESGDDHVKTSSEDDDHVKTDLRSIGFLGFIGSQSRGEHTVDIFTQNNLHPLLEHQHNQHKPINSKKPRKPPRPPKPPSLTASDLKLVREITQLTMKKRARIERIKTLKKMRAAKSSSSPPSSSSSNSSLTAIIITAVFCFVIILQGFSSRTATTMDFQGSPGPSSEPEGLISVQLYNLSPNARAEQSWESSPRAARPRFLWQGSGPRHRILNRNKWQ